MAGLAKAFGSGAMTNSISDIQDAEVIFIIGSNTTEAHPIISLEVRQAVRSGKTKLIVADPRRIPLVRYADLWLSQEPGTDVALINGLLNVIITESLVDRNFIDSCTVGFAAVKKSVKDFTPQRVSEITGIPAEMIQAAARMYGQAQRGSIIYAMGITQHTTGTDNVLALANLAMATGNIGKPGTGVNPLRGQNNVQGACDMGGLPNVLPGYQQVASDVHRQKFEAAWGCALPQKPGMTVTEMLPAARSGAIKMLLIMGENPMLSDADLGHVSEAIEALDFLVVSDIFMTETGRLADVILPAVSFAEKDGTFTNTERRVQLLNRAIDPPGSSKPDWRIWSELAVKLGAKMHYRSTARILDEAASVTPSYGGINHARLKQGGIQWPCPDCDHPGTPILHTESFVCGLGIFNPVDFKPPAEKTSSTYPFILTTGRVLEHYHTGTMTRRSIALSAAYPEALVQVNPADASRLQIQDGDMIELASRRGSIRVKAELTEQVRPGTVFMAFHFAEAAVNRLTNAALDPVAKIPEFKVCAVRIKKVSKS